MLLSSFYRRKNNARALRTHANRATHPERLRQNLIAVYFTLLIIQYAGVA